jgi:hypothetical protein
VVAGILAALTIALVTVFAVLSTDARDLSIGNFWSAVVTIVPIGAIGLLVAARQPRNPIGWMCLAEALMWALGAAGGEYSVLAYQMGRHLPAGPVALLLALYWSPMIVVFPVVVLLFPDGTLPSRRWRIMLWAYLAIGAIWPASTYAVAISAIGGHDTQVVSGGDLRAVDFPTGSHAWLSAIDSVVLPVLGAFWLLFALRQVLSWRRADGERRQQLKWLMLGTGVCLVCTLLIVIPATLDPSAGANSAAAQLFVAITGLGIAALPVGMGVAILRYRLYDIDRIISRTLAYTIVTGLLVGLYAGLVLLATLVVPAARSTPIVVAGATLIAAALFNPLRRRVQRIVDRRFNRARYDADQTVAAFATLLTGAVDLVSVQADLLAAVHGSLEPAHASIWLTRD